MLHTIQTYFNVFLQFLSPSNAVVKCDVKNPKPDFSCSEAQKRYLNSCWIKTGRSNFCPYSLLKPLICIHGWNLHAQLKFWHSKYIDNWQREPFLVQLRKRTGEKKIHSVLKKSSFNLINWAISTQWTICVRVRVQAWEHDRNHTCQHN